MGPGDPDLLTIKAVKALSGADVIIAPRTEKRGDSIALAIARPHLRPDSRVLELVFPMVYETEELNEAWRENRDIILSCLEAGQNVAFLTLGDPMFYSTYIYVFELLKGCGYPIETIPGITSFCAIASHHATPVVEGDDVLSIVPATIAPEKMDRVMAASDRVVMMKLSRNFVEVRNRLKIHGFAENALMVSKCGQPEEVVHENLLAVPPQEVTYLSTILARKTKIAASHPGETETGSAGKKVILAVSFGTSVPETRIANIDVLENEIRLAFPGWEVRRAFTSGMVRAKIATEEGLVIDSPLEALERLRKEGVKEVIVQPTHIIPGDEYDRLTAAMAPFSKSAAFDSLKLGRPLLCFEGTEEDEVDDFALTVEALKAQMPTGWEEESTRIILMGHGSGHVSDRCYDLLQDRLERASLPVFTATVEGARTFESAVEWLERQKAEKVVLMPFMLVAGDHAMNDMAGPEEDSWQSQLIAAGYRAESVLKGLGENPAIRAIYLQHIREARKFEENMNCYCLKEG